MRRVQRMQRFKLLEMNRHKYKLEKYNGVKTRFTCPNCQHITLVRYIDTERNQHLNLSVGRCNREVKCGYHLTPKQYFSENGNEECPTKPYNNQKVVTAKQKKVSFIPVEVLEETIANEGFETNTFIQNLLNSIAFPFEAKDVEKVISQYYLGTVCNGYRAGAITFPFIDRLNNIRAIQVKQFDETNRTIGTDFIHSIIEKQQLLKNESLPDWLEDYKANDLKVSCLFGEHLLNRFPMNPVALVEAAKTAIYSTLYFGFPDLPESFLWLAVYNLSSLNYEKCKELQGRDVYLFPDLSIGGKAFDLWSKRAKELSALLPGTHFEVSDLLETRAPNSLRNEGADIADILIKFDWRKFRPHQIESIQQSKLQNTELITHLNSEKSEAVKKLFFSDDEDYALFELLRTEQIKSYRRVKESWDEEIGDLEHYFETANLPTHCIKLDQCTNIIDIKKFIDCNLSTVKANNGNMTYRSYLTQLQKIKQILIDNSILNEGRGEYQNVLSISL